MPNYVVLGSTANVGLNILRTLADQTKSDTPDPLQIKAYVRSKDKLLSMYPEASTNQHISIFAGALHDIDNLGRCLDGVDAAFPTVASSDNIPNTTIAQDTTRLVVEALAKLRKQQNDRYHPPILVVLSSTSTSEYLSGNDGLSSFAHTVLWKAASYVYEDLVLAEKFLRSYQAEHRGLFRMAFVKPGGLVVDAKQGHVLSTEGSKTFTSFADCAGGMVEIAASPDLERWDGKEVSVNSAAPNGVALTLSTGFTLMWFPPRGLLFHFVPQSYKWVKG